MPERGVDNNGHLVVRVLAHKGAHGFVELLKARCGATFGGDVRPVDHDVLVGHVVISQANTACTLVDAAASGGGATVRGMGVTAQASP